MVHGSWLKPHASCLKLVAQDWWLMAKATLALGLSGPGPSDALKFMIGHCARVMYQMQMNSRDPRQLEIQQNTETLFLKFFDAFWYRKTKNDVALFVSFQ